MARTLDEKIRDLKNGANLWLKDHNADEIQAGVNLALRQGGDALTTLGMVPALGLPRTFELKGWSNGQQKSSPASSAIPASDRSAASPARSRRPVIREPDVLPTEPNYITKPKGLSDSVWAGVMQADAAVRQASNVVTFGGADRAEAAMNALMAPGGLHDWGRRYKLDLAQEFARDHYNATERPVAHAVGSVGGVVLGLGAGGPIRLAPGAARLAGAAAMTGREALARSGAGAVSGLASQAAVDIATGHRSTAGDNFGAAVGGAAGAMVPFGPRAMGAVGGWTTSMAQDLFNGRRIDLDHASESALAGGVVSGVVGRKGGDVAQGLHRTTKGKLGEAMGAVRSAINGELREGGPKKREYLPDGSYWYPDGRRGHLRFEDKFGFGAKLSDGQEMAQALHGPNFRLYHSTPDTVSGLLGVVAGPAGTQLPQGTPDTSASDY